MTGRGVDSAAARVAVTVAPVKELNRSIQFFLTVLNFSYCIFKLLNIQISAYLSRELIKREIHNSFVEFVYAARK